MLFGHHEKYNTKAKGLNTNIMTEIFNKYYYQLYSENDRNNYLGEIYRLYNDEQISLHKTSNKNRINIFDMLK